MAKKTLDDINVDGKTVLVRVDFNVPIEQGIEFLPQYDHRLRATLPTLQRLHESGCKLVLCSHLGRPKGQVVEGLRMGPVAERLSALMGLSVKSLDDCVGAEVEDAVSAMSPGEIIMLENLRFHTGEESADPEFAKSLAAVADIFVMDAFAVAHRAHASVVGVPQYLPTVAGELVKAELENMGRALEAPQRPLAALMGGAKVSDKIMVLENLIDKIDRLFIGGGMAVTFLKAQGHSVGASRVEEDRLEFASQILERAGQLGVEVHLPTDMVVADEVSADAGGVNNVGVDEIPENSYALDIGQVSAVEFAQGLKECGTVIWNGPMGVFEFEPFSHGTRKVGQALAEAKAATIVGGGSTAEAVEEMGIQDSMTHVSTGGGASLEFLEGKELPGIAAILDKDC